MKYTYGGVFVFSAHMYGLARKEDSEQLVSHPWAEWYDLGQCRSVALEKAWNQAHNTSLYFCWFVLKQNMLGNAMSGETSLQHLLAHLSPMLDPTPLVFCSIKHGRYGDLAECHPIASIREPEGLTLVLPQSEADSKGFHYDGVFHSILLEVHSSLLAVGLTARISTTLAQAGISVNMLAGTYHDQVLVPIADAQRALELLLTIK